ncbi:MAG: hypothetical protein JWN36_2240 [Microbacteriaceae bacterium]|nr:hypothetical protein [Microbacteriaceae bacterium]
MTDETTRDNTPTDPRELQRNLAERLFPGPTKVMSNQRTEHIDRLLRQRGNPWAEKARADAKARVERPARGATPEPATENSASTNEDLVKLGETLEQQNELLRAILSSTVDSQTDARSTAQNSRTFAWAGTAIALLTLIATVILIVEAVGGA